MAAAASKKKKSDNEQKSVYRTNTHSHRPKCFMSKEIGAAVGVLLLLLLTVHSAV